MADLAWDFATKEGFRVFKAMPPVTPSGRSYSTWAWQGPFPRRSYVTVPRSSSAPAHLILSPEGLSGRAQDLYGRLRRFMDAHVYPAEQALRDHQVSQTRWTPHPLVEELKVSDAPALSSDSSKYSSPGCRARCLCLPPSHL